MTDTYMAIVAH